jgi:hypothetical protein
MEGRTRDEHLQWCKDRAIAEFGFYLREGIGEAVRNGITSMMSDMDKNEETKMGAALRALCFHNMINIQSRSEFVTFIEGFH